MLRVIKNRKSKYLSTGFSCSKELWDEKSNLPKKKPKMCMSEVMTIMIIFHGMQHKNIKHFYIN